MGHRAVYRVDRDRQSVTRTSAPFSSDIDSHAHPDASRAPQLSDGPDEFGYTWSDQVAYEWVDLSEGTSITPGVDLRDDDWVGPYDIGFTFNFYGQDYTQFYIDSNGYIGFDETQTASYYANTRLPHAGRPNGLIAPFWDNFDPSQGGEVRFWTFGSDPDRYLVVEWTQVPLHDSSSDTQTFQVILYEGSNDIKFQYPDTRQGEYGDRRSGTVGIENEDGTIGLEHLYLIPITQTYAIQFDYHRSDYNAFMTPGRQGSPAAPGEIAEFPLTVRNLGANADTFTLSRPAYNGSNWSVGFYEADGSTPLAGNSTGTIPASGEKEIVAKVQIPTGAANGDWTRATIRATSQANASEYHEVTIDTMVGTTFAQAYTDNESGDGTEDSENYFALIEEGEHFSKRLTTDQDDSSYAGVATTPKGHTVNVWNTEYHNGATWVIEINYAIVNPTGKFVVPVTRLTDNSGAGSTTYDFSPAVDVAANGHIAIGWARQPGTYNVWYSVVDDSGGTVRAPTPLTSNIGDYPRDYPPSVAALKDGRFLLAWEHAAASGGPVDIKYAILNNDGSIAKSATMLTDGAGLSMTPRVAPMPDGQAAIVWTTYNVSGYPEIAYAILNSNGDVTLAPTTITGNGSSSARSYYADIVALSDNRLAVAWTQQYDSDRQIQYTILSGETPPTPTLTPTSSAGGINGKVRYQGTGISGIHLALRFYDGSNWSTADTTTTQADGSYEFTGVASLTSGQKYYVRFQNGEYGNTSNSDYLAFWSSFQLTSYTAGTSAAGGDFDIADIPLVSPDSSITAPLPQMFQWTQRAATTSDSYEFNLFDPADNDPWWWTDPRLGYVGSYTLESLPAGFSTGAEYGWNVWVYGPDGGYGVSYYYRRITFSSGSDPTPTPTPTPTSEPDGIYGNVTLNGAAASGVELILRYYNGSDWSTRATVTTDSNGDYIFTGVPSLGSGERYYVQYTNPSETANGRLGLWNGASITSYASGSRLHGGDFDIKDIPLQSPANGSSVTLPHTFQWDFRGIASDDHYQFFILDPVDNNLAYINRGYDNSVTINTLPSGWPSGRQYGWWVSVCQDADCTAYGWSYEIRSVTINTTARSGEEPATRFESISPVTMTDDDVLLREFPSPRTETNRAAPDVAPNRTMDIPISMDPMEGTRSPRSTPAAPPQPRGPSQAIYTVPNDLSTANIYVSLTTDEDDNLIMTWLDDASAQYLFYALADSSGNTHTPATIFQRTRRSYLWSSWNGYGNDSLLRAHAVYLPVALKVYQSQTPGPTPTPTPTPKPLTNGGFESGNLSGWTPGWTETGGAGLAPQAVTSRRHSGSYAAVLGQENAPCETGKGGLVGQSWIYQDIEVPNSSSPQLSLYYRIFTYDKLNADEYDRFEVFIGGTLLGRFGNTGQQGCPDVKDLNWQQFTYDLSAYRGQTIRLRLVNITHPDDWFGTWTYVDDVSVTP
ncbi:MAG: hypothetical protein ACLFTI_04480 [Anaerolineales bacterium]